MTLNSASTIAFTRSKLLTTFLVMMLTLLLAACGGTTGNSNDSLADANGESQETPGNTGNSQVFRIGAIPDQSASALSRQFGSMAEYLSEATGLRVEYVPTMDYAAIVTAMERGDMHLAWLGGLTAVQVHNAAPGSESFAQRPRDAEFHSKFIAQADLPIEELQDLRGFSFTFGSESSTSGHLMPRYFLMRAGIDPETDFNGVANFSGSHDKTYKLVESGAYQTGALNEAVWEQAVADGRVDTSKVRVFYTTPSYYDYNWTFSPGIDEKFGAGTAERFKQAILGMSTEDPDQKKILDLFATDGFIPTKNDNYEAIREVAERIGVIR